MQSTACGLRETKVVSHALLASTQRYYKKGKPMNTEKDKYTVTVCWI